MFLESCTSLPEEFSEDSSNALSNDIKDAKDWFEKNESNILLSSKNPETFKTTPKEKIQKTPNWGLNLTHSNLEGRTVIEVSLDVDKEFVPKDFLDKTKSKNRADYHVLHHLLLAKTNSGDYDAFILKIFSETNLGLKGKKNIFENLNYGNTPNDFTGYMVLTTIDDEVLKGWIFEDGRIIKTTRPVDPQSKKTNSLSFSWECGFVETHWYSQACEASGCSAPVLIDITYDYECNDSGDSSSLNKEAASLQPAGPGGGGGGLGDPIEEEKPKKLNCTELKNDHNEHKNDIIGFMNSNRGKTYQEIISQRENRSWSFLNSQQGGPSIRYITDPLNPNIIIDLRHLLIVGKLGRATGESIEIMQVVSDNPSGYDDQDFYSNELGYSFFKLYGEAIKYNTTATADYLASFLYDVKNRNSISTPERCKF